MRKVISAAAVATVLLMAPASEALAATYIGSRMIGTAFLNIRIDTDGKTGQLTAANLIDWRISVKRGAQVFELNGPLSGANSSVFAEGGSFSATKDHIFFDYDTTSRAFVTFIEGSASPSQYAIQSFGTGRPGEAYRFGDDLFTTLAPRSDFAIIASAVPEPATWALMIGGFAAAGMSLRSRRQVAFSG